MVDNQGKTDGWLVCRCVPKGAGHTCTCTHTHTTHTAAAAAAAAAAAPTTKTMTTKISLFDCALARVRV